MKLPPIGLPVIAVLTCILGPFCNMSAATDGHEKNERYVYSQITIDRGISRNISCVYKEKDRYLWAGTGNGIYRIDGNETKWYRLNGPGEIIFDITSDKAGNFWAISNRGVAIYERETDRFAPLEAAGEEQGAILSCCPDNDCIWFAGRGGKIYRFDYAERHLDLFTEISHSGRPVDINCMTALPDGKILCSDMQEGLILLDKEDGSVSGTPFACPQGVIETMLDSRGLLWITCFNKGIWGFRLDGTLAAHYDTESGMSNNIVLSMTEKGQDIWLGTDGGGINILNPVSGEISVLEHLPGDISSLPANTITSIDVDDYGNVWAGTTRNGVINICSTGMVTYTDVPPGESMGLSNPTVLCLYQENGSDTVWIGTDGEGINAFIPETRTFRHFRKTFGQKVVSLASFGDGRLAVSLYADGLYVFDPVSGTMSPMHIDDMRLLEQLKYSRLSINLLNENDGSLLLLSSEVRRLDSGTGRTETIPISDGQGILGYFLPAGRDEANIYLHDSKSVYRMRCGSHFIERIFRVDGSTMLTTALMDSDGTLWLGSDKGFDKVTGAGTDMAVQTSVNPGLQNISIIQEDNRGRIWIGEEERLFAYLKRDGSFAMFGESDGVRKNEYMRKARLLAGSGDIYLGGAAGLLRIDGGFRIDTDEKPRLRLSEMTMDGSEMHPDGRQTIRIPSGTKTLTMRVMAEEKDMFRQKIYKFDIPGLGMEPFESFEPEFVLRPLPPPGKYSVYASCSTRDGGWTAPEEIAVIDVQTAWYRTWWFLLICICGCGALGIWIFRTILLQKEDKMKLEMKEKERTASEEKVRFLINVSHELRTPLTLVIAPLKRILRKMNPDETNYAQLNMAYRQSQRMKELLNTVLDLRKMEVKENRLTIESVMLNEWIADVSRDYVDEGGAIGIEIRTDFDKNLGKMNFDRKKCETVLTNLLINAMRHSEKGDRIIIRTIATETSGVRIEVTDQGPGLNGIDPEKLFTRFYQRENEKSGSGIGLSYAKILVELHGGSIGAYDNTNGKGATFWFEIPADIPVGNIVKEPKAYLNKLIGTDDYATSVPEEASHEDGMAEERVAEEEKARIKMLFVDDSDELSEFIRSEFLGYADVLTVPGGKAALEVIRKIIPDIVVSDINMPDGDGYELCRAIRDTQEYRHIPVILLTAQNDEATQREGYRAGATAFLAKPFETETLYELVLNILKQRDETRQRYLQTWGSKTEGNTISSAEEVFLIKLNRFIDENLGDPGLDIPMICKGIGISRALLYNKLKAITGIGANEYITNIRMERAVKMIEETDLSFAEIAEKTGFSTASYFSTAFKKHTGLSPSRYKEKKSKV